MNSPNALHRQPHVPRPGVRYPIKLGKSIIKPNNSRSLLSLRFSHVPSSVNPHAAGVLIPDQNSCAVEFPLSNQPARAACFDCQRSQPKADVRNYALVFAKDAFWLERVDHVFNSTRAGTINPQTTPVPPAPVDSVANDPDSWMDIDSPSGSPVTPDGNEGAPVDDHPPISSRGGKSLPGYERMSAPHSPHTSTTADVPSSPLPILPPTGKSIAVKTPTPAPPTNADARSDAEEEAVSSDDDDSSEESGDSDSSGDSSSDYTEDSSSEEE